MAVDEIQGSSGFDPQKISENAKLRLQAALQNSGEKSSEIQKSGDTVELSDLARFTKIALESPTPNEANIAEIQQAIEDGKYHSEEVLQEAAGRIADQLIS